MAKIRDIFGPYRLTRLIRNDSNSQIWEGLQDAEKQRVIIRLIKDNFKNDKDEIATLKNEHEISKTLSSPVISKSIDHRTESGLTLNVFKDYYADTHFKNLIRMGVDEYGFLLPKMIQKAAEAVYYLHTKDFLHRDIKPENFMVTRDGGVTLVDLRISEKKKTGISKMFGKSKVQGTRSYMSPEQIRGKGMDERLDIYSFGCMLFELTTGKMPYTANTPDELLNKHLTAQIPSPITVNPNVSVEFADIIKKMMSKKKEARPASMWELLKDLRTTQIFKKAARIPQVHPFDHLEDGEQGMNIE